MVVSPTTRIYDVKITAKYSRPRRRYVRVLFILSGRSANPIWLEISGSGVVCHDATELWGKETYTTEDEVVAMSESEAGAMVIGPAGENRVSFACIKSDRWRSLGRGGMGAVLGSKLVKAISFAGEEKAEIADIDLVRSPAKRI